MVELDTELAGLLQTQAAEVEELRNNMYGVGGTLFGGSTRLRRPLGLDYRRFTK